MIVREDIAQHRLPTHPGPSILDEAKTMKGGFGTDTVLGQACSWDRSFKILGTGPLLGQAVQNSWGKPALGAGPSKFLGQARSLQPMKTMMALLALKTMGIEDYAGFEFEF